MTLDNPTRQVRDMLIAVLPDIFTSTLNKQASDKAPASTTEEDLHDVADDLLGHWCTFQSQLYVLKQYEEQFVCPVLDFTKIEWEVIGRAEDAEKYVIDHECDGCLAGKSKAETFLHNHPGKNLVFVSIHYNETWPRGTTGGKISDRVEVPTS